MAFDFNGTADEISLASGAPANSPITLACWFNCDQSTLRQTLLSVNDNASRQALELQVAGDVALDPVALRSTASAGGTSDGVSATGYTTGTWFHAAGVLLNDTSRTAYIGGVAGTTGTTSRTVAGLDSFRIGCGETGTAAVTAAFFDGRIAEAAVWNTNLTTPEIAALARGYSPLFIRRANLVFYAPLLRSGVINLRGAALTVTGTPAVAAHSRVIYPRGFQIVPSAATAYTLAAASGSYALTGSTAALTPTRKLTAASGAYALTGSAAALRRAITIAAASGVYSLTGSAAGLRTTRSMAAASGSYALTGSQAALRAARRLAAESGAYVLTGSPAGLNYDAVAAADDRDPILLPLGIGRTVDQLGGLAIWKSKRRRPN